MGPGRTEDIIALPSSGGDGGDPYMVFARLREAGPVHRVRLFGGREAWLVTRHDIMLELLSGRRLDREPPSSDSYMELTELRRIAGPLLSQSAVARLEPVIAEAATRLLGDARAAAEADLVDAYCRPLAGVALDEILSVPAPDRPLTMTRIGPFSPAGAAHAAKERQDALAWLTRYFAELKGTGEPGFAEAAVLLAIAGFEPTVNLLSSSLLALLKHPAALRDLRRNPKLCCAAAHELIRYDAPVYPGMMRTALDDIDVCGRRIAKGDLVLFPISAAGRDPSRNDDPDALDWSRRPRPHLAFGHGRHVCPGAALAMLVHRIAIETFVRHMEKSHVALGSQGPVWSSGPVRALLRLPVSFTAAEGPPRGHRSQAVPPV
jgi:cytochrome P450